MSRGRRTKRCSIPQSIASSGSRFRASFCSVALCLAVSGCFKPDDGREPPLNRIYFPTGLALSPDADRLYVANGDWDLQFNAGSVQAYDAARLRALLPHYCNADADCAAPDEVCDLPRADTAGLG